MLFHQTYKIKPKNKANYLARNLCKLHALPQESCRVLQLCSAPQQPKNNDRIKMNKKKATIYNSTANLLIGDI